MLASRNQKLNQVIELRVDDEELIKRIAGRYTCAKCFKGYHDEFAPTRVAGICDNCGSNQFIRRPDDKAETVRERLRVYNRQTAPLISYYGDKGALKTVNGMAPIEEVARQIEQSLDRA
jgi:adenylate kinase